MSLERETLVRMDSENPRYLCCGRKVEALTLRIAIVEIVISLVALVVVLAVTSSKAPVALPSVAVTVVLYVSVKVGVCACVLYGILRNKHAFLIAYLVFKGLEISAAAIGILISFLVMVGFTTFFGLITSSMPSGPPHTPESIEDMEFGEVDDAYMDDSLSEAVTDPSDYHAHVTPEAATLSSVEFTGVMAGLFVVLGTVIGTGVYFFIAVLKTYHMLQDRDYHQYNMDVGKRSGTVSEGGTSSGYHSRTASGADSIVTIPPVTRLNASSFPGIPVHLIPHHMMSGRMGRPATMGHHRNDSQDSALLHHDNSSGDLIADAGGADPQPAEQAAPKDPDHCFTDSLAHYFMPPGPRFERL